ncbi:hypothetical protein [Kitasatospora sp. NPDC097691]|uniref:hypothetical protein n=1 Tax=Kitasatospora sp. NPDC097691 TaxID=3157231 RepID=UPI00331A7D1F
MGVLFGYYAADGDEDARRAVERDDDEPTGTGYDEFVVKGIDPVVDLLPAEVLISGRSADVVEADPRHGHLVAMVGDGEVVSVSITDAFRDSIADFNAELLGDVVARSWSASDVFSTPPDPDGLAEFLSSLAALARRSVARGQNLYCWICP